MPCFCKMSVSPIAPRLAKMSFKFTPPSMPLALQLVAKIPTLKEEPIDLSVVNATQTYTLPNLNLGPAMPVIGSLTMAIGALKLTSLESIAVDVPLAMNSFEQNVLPRLRHLASINIRPIMALAGLAGLVLAVKAVLGIDPVKVNAEIFADATTKAAANRMRMNISNPVRLKAGKIALLYPMVQLAEALKLDVGEQGMLRAASARLRFLASIRPSGFNITILPLVMKLAVVLQAIVTIEEAFGIDALAPSGRSAMRSSYRMMGSFSLPTPGIQAALKIPAPPPMPPLETLQPVMNASWVGAASMKFSGLSFPIMPSLMATATLALALKSGFDIEPLGLGACGACNFV